ncbi:TIGR02530 family flagellar biosynthesis protein [Anaerospora hongkongensis]|uniref:TIGR02530 family flagellar biosynthesis protein n=1 Tax=Anaerospora hongkongensis TaxID=244830 RepID=UPI00289E5F79|nr:TIGR02530 family flagellar biosynthesis protein [Anaerospora hongkongensis]
MGDNRIYYPQTPLIQTPQINKSSVIKPGTSVANSGKSFTEILEKQLSGEVKFSQHALQRLQSRNIKLDETAMDKLSGAVDKAAQKGAKESLILMNNLALVVSVKNRTVITAMDEASMKENVFTNIDSAVIV